MAPLKITVLIPAVLSHSCAIPFLQEDLSLTLVELPLSVRLSSLVYSFLPFKVVPSLCSSCTFFSTLQSFHDLSPEGPPPVTDMTHITPGLLVSPAFSSALLAIPFQCIFFLLPEITPAHLTGSQIK